MTVIVFGRESRIMLHLAVALPSAVSPDALTPLTVTEAMPLPPVDASLAVPETVRRCEKIGFHNRDISDKAQISRRSGLIIMKKASCAP
jgi:hypothetical protein